MLDIVKFEGVKAKVQIPNFKFFTIAVLAIAILVISGCNETGTTTPTGSVDPNEIAATVNGKAIKLVEVERVIKQQRTRTRSEVFSA